MAFVKGNDYVLKLAATATGSAYSTVGALTANEVTFSRELIDVTNKDNAGWVRNLDSQRGVSITGTGILQVGLSAQTLLFSMFDAGTAWNCQMVALSAYTLEGAFQLTELSTTGGVNERTEFSFTLQSDGTIVRT